MTNSEIKKDELKPCKHCGEDFQLQVIRVDFTNPDRDIIKCRKCNGSVCRKFWQHPTRTPEPTKAEQGISKELNSALEKELSKQTRWTDREKTAIRKFFEGVVLRLDLPTKAENGLVKIADLEHAFCMAVMDSEEFKRYDFGSFITYNKHTFWEGFKAIHNLIIQKQCATPSITKEQLTHVSKNTIINCIGMLKSIIECKYNLTEQDVGVINSAYAEIDKIPTKEQLLAILPEKEHLKFGKNEAIDQMKQRIEEMFKKDSDK